MTPAAVLMTCIASQQPICSQVAAYLLVALLSDPIRSADKPMLVGNTLKTLGEILPVLMDQLIASLASQGKLLPAPVLLVEQDSWCKKHHVTPCNNF